MDFVPDVLHAAWGLIAYVGLALFSAWTVVVPILIVGGLVLFVIGLLNRRRRRALADAVLHPHHPHHESGTGAG